MEKKSDSRKNILVAFFLNFFFVIIELVGGLFTNSVAILSDAVHDLGDCLSIAFAYFLEKLSYKEPDDSYTYGYRRYSLVSAIITGLILVVGGVLVIYTSVQRLAHPQAVNAPGMIILSVVGIVINGIAVLKTSHGRGASERVISLHMLEDVLGWAVVLIGSICIQLFNAAIIDPILSIAVSAFILWQAVKNILSVVSILLEKTPSGFDTAGYTDALRKIEGVSGAHHVHVWSLDGEGMLATVHVVASGEINSDVLRTVKHEAEEISESFGISHVTVQVDTEEQECADDRCSIHNEEHEEGHHHHHH